MSSPINSDEQIKFGQRLKSWILDNYKNVREFSDKEGIPYGSIQNYFRGHRSPSAEMQFKLLELGFSDFDQESKPLFMQIMERATGSKMSYSEAFKEASSPNEDQSSLGKEERRLVTKDDYEMEREAKKSHRCVRVLDVEASAGEGTIAYDESDEDGYMFSNRWLRSKGLLNANLSVINVNGDSMEPEVPHGAMVLVHHGTPPIEGKVAVIREKGELFVKRLRLARGGWIGVSDNPIHGTIEIEEDSSIIGVCVSVMKDI